MGLPEKIKILLNKIEERIEKDRSEFLLGSIEVDDTYSELLDYATSLIDGTTLILRDYKYAVISLALVQFAIKEYNNGQFWKEFSDRTSVEEIEARKIGKEAIELFCENEGVYFHLGKVNKGYVTSILTHAIIPNSSINKFLEFLGDIYFKDLDEDYIDSEVEELIQYMHRLFSKYLDEDDISMIVQGSKMTIARQQLPKAFRIAFVNSASVVSPIIERLLFYIDQSNYGEVIEYFEEDRFDEYFSFHDNSTIRISRKSSKRDGIYENIRKFQVAKYQYENRKLSLYIPKQIIDSDYIEDQIGLEVFSGDSLIYSETLVLTKSRLFFKTEHTFVNLNRFYHNLSYKIRSGNKVIYDSGESLFKDYIIFDLEGNEISPKHLSDDTVRVVTYSDNDVLSDDVDVDNIFEYNYRISTLTMNEDSILLINDKVLTTDVVYYKSEIDLKFKHQNVKVKNSYKVMFDVYTRVPEIRLRIPHLKTSEDFIVSINNLNYHLTEIATCVSKLITDGSGDSLGIIRIQDSILDKNRAHSIVIREKGSNRKYIEEDIFILKDFKFEFDKDYYYREEEAELLFLKANDIEFKNNCQFPYKINIKKIKKFCSLLIVNDMEYEIEIDIPVLAWRISNINSNSRNSENIWWEDIQDYKMYIHYPKEISKLYIISDLGFEEVDGKKEKDEYRYSLENLFQTTDKGSITLGICLNGKEEKITEICFKPMIKDFTIGYNNKTRLIQGLFATWTFLGKGDLEINLIYSPNNRIIKHYQLSDSNILMDRDISLYYSEHDIEIYQIEDDDFFGGKPEKNVLLKEKFVVGDQILVACKNKVLKGKRCLVGDDKFDLSNFYLKDIKFSKEKGCYEAIGFYHRVNANTGKEIDWYFTHHNPFIIKPIKQEKEKITVEIVDREKDGLVYDTKTKYVNPKEIGKKERYKLIDAIVLEITEGGGVFGVKSN